MTVSQVSISIVNTMLWWWVEKDLLMGLKEVLTCVMNEIKWSLLARSKLIYCLFRDLANNLLV